MKIKLKIKKKNENPYFCLGNIICCSVILFTVASTILFLFLIDDLTFDEIKFNSTNITNITNITTK